MAGRLDDVRRNRKVGAGRAAAPALEKLLTLNLLTVVRSAPLKDAVECTVHPIFSASAHAPDFQTLQNGAPD
jgi:hypothetical protein